MRTAGRVLSLLGLLFSLLLAVEVPTHADSLSAVSAPTIALQKAGTTFSLTPATWSAPTKSTFAWLVNGKVVAGATKKNFTAPNKKGSVIQARETANGVVANSNKITIGAVAVNGAISISFADKPASVAPSLPTMTATDLTTIDLEKELSSINLDEVPKMTGPGIPDFSSSAPAPSFSFEPSVSIPQTPQLSYEQIQAQKFDYLCKLERLQKNGAKTSRIFSMSSDLEEIRMEYEKIMYERRLQNSIKMQRQILITCCSGIEFLNGKFDPFGVQLDDWSGSVNDEIETYDDVFTELYEKYQGQGSMAPELKLLLMVGGSALTYHLSQTMFKKMPNGENVMKNNPELRRQFEEAALREMSQEAPGFAKFAGMASGLGRGGSDQPPPFRAGGGGATVNVDDIDTMINDISNSI